jgi:hypothetical protein
MTSRLALRIATALSIAASLDHGQALVAQDRRDREIKRFEEVDQLRPRRK